MLHHGYSDTISHKKVAVLGPYPPPLGGVSIHIKRAIGKLIRQENKVFHFDTTKRCNKIWYSARLLSFLFSTRPDIVHYHTAYMNRSLHEFRLLLFCKRLLSFKIVVIDHNCRHLYTRDERYKKNYNRLLSQIDKLVVIGDSTAKSYSDNSIASKDISIEAAFLSPDVSEEKKIQKTYPVELQDFFSVHKPVLIANASQFSLMDGKDLYGIDNCIFLITSLKKEFPNIGLVLALPHGDEGYHLQELIKKMGVENNVYLLLGQYELWPLLKKADLFVRPTLSDGDSISVREALFFKVPVVASDVCTRPKGTTVFDVADPNAFQEKVTAVLKEVL